MPIYEYQCSNCGHELEELQTMSELPLVKCPNCGKDTLKRLIGTGGGLIFKGSGFYLTDYKNQPKDTSKATSDISKDSKPSIKSSDSKEAKTTESKTTESKTTESKTTESKIAESKQTNKTENKKS